VIPVFSEPVQNRLLSAAAYRLAADVALCSFQGPWRGDNAGSADVCAYTSNSCLHARRADAGLSKLNSMLGLLWPEPSVLPK
jgi:hypothetical protein